MATAFKDLQSQPEARALEHGEWLALLLEREATLRRQKRFESRARAARLRHDAHVEDVDFRAARGLDRALFLKLAGCDWIRERRSLLLTGPAGVGKSWLACALGHKACREDFSVVYHRAPGCLRRSPWRAETAVMHACSRRWPAWTCSFSTIGGPRSSMTISGGICWRSSRTAMSGAPPSSRARFPVDRWYEIIGNAKIS